MERVMSVEEKIRRAEEIYERRKQGEVRSVAKVTVNDKKDIKLLKKMIIQVLVCIAIYLLIYMIQNNEYIFSNDFIHRANEILSQDTNFLELYESIKNQIMNFITKKSEDEVNKEAIGGAEEVVAEQQEDNNTNTQEEITNAIVDENTQNLSQAELDIINVKNTTTFIKPIEGVISSKYGQRDTATGRVPKNHTGTDIAASTGTKIKSATDGEVVLASSEGDYRESFKNSNRRSKYYLRTL